jgi:hypothetical protein
MRYRIHAQKVFLGLLLLLFAADGFAAGLQANLDPTRIAEGETALLTLSAPADVSGTPDLSPLKQAFDLLGQRQSSQTRIVNGQSSSSRQWRITLAPKRTGQLSIPVLHWGGLSSESLQLQVLPAGKAAQLGMARPVMLEVEAKPEHPYVQAKVIYTVRLLYRADLQEASLSEPQVENGIIESLGEDKRYNTERDGQSYQVIERRYAIFPQASGKLEIEAPVLSARIPDTSRQSTTRGGFFGGGDPFAEMDRFFGNNGFPDMGMFPGQGKPIELRGRRIALDVKPQPAGTVSPWLPAESLTLNEAWSPDPPQFHVGEPATRTIAITAQGLSASQLPDLDLPAVAGIKAYPDKPQTETHASGDTLVAQKTFKVALVPSQAGSYTLPEIGLKWWDVAAGKQRSVRIPPREIKVLPGVSGSGASSASNPDSAVTTAGAESQAQSPSPVTHAAGSMGVAQDAVSNVAQAATQNGYWPWLTAIFALAWLVSSGLWIHARRSNGRPVPVEESVARPPPANPGRAMKRLEQACRENNARAARQALLDWAAAQWPEQMPGGLEVVELYLGSDVREIVQKLDRGLYGEGRGDWDGAAAWSRLLPALEKARHAGSRMQPETPLPALYPQAV